MSDESDTPDHLDWLVEQRAANQRATARLYRFLAKHQKRITHSRDRNNAQLLVITAFSLWRAAFLSDKTGKADDTYAAGLCFLEEMLRHNAIAYPQDQKHKNWTFSYYMYYAYLCIGEYCRGNRVSDLRREGFFEKSPKAKWQHLQQAFEKTIDHFQARLEQAAKRAD